MHYEEDIIIADPIIIGKQGKAWLTKDKSQLLLSSWIIEAPWAHPMWHSYSLALVHLRPLKDRDKIIKYLDNATHEIVLHTININEDRQDMIDTGIIQIIAPSNFAAQFIANNDKDATEKVEKVVQSICDGNLSPDALSEWIKIFGSNMIQDHKVEWIH